MPTRCLAQGLSPPENRSPRDTRAEVDDAKPVQRVGHAVTAPSPKPV